MSDAKPVSPLASPDAWNLVSDDYTLELLPMFELFSKDALALAPTHAGARVLDVAAGPGSLTLLAAEAGSSVAAIDFSPQMVTNLKRRLNGAQLGADVRLGDAQELPWSDAEFDAAFSMFGLMFFPDRGKGLGEMRRVLKPGCTAVISSWAPIEGLFKSMMNAMQAVMPDIPFGNGKGPLGDPNELALEMTAARFEDVRVVQKTHSLPVDSAAAMWAMSERTTAPIVLLRRSLGEAKWAEVSRDVAAKLQAEYGSGPMQLSTTALLGVGRKG